MLSANSLSNWSGSMLGGGVDEPRPRGLNAVFELGFDVATVFTDAAFGRTTGDFFATT